MSADGNEADVDDGDDNTSGTYSSPPPSPPLPYQLPLDQGEDDDFIVNSEVDSTFAYEDRMQEEQES